MIKGAVMNEHKKHGSSFSSKMGFILAAAGSAVGLGNLWRFPYLAAKYGGGSFLLIYVILAVTFGFALMITEIALGRKTGKSALYAFSTLHEKCGFIGILASIVPIIILPYYCVIGGWVIKFAWAFLTGSGNAAAADDYFSNFIARTGEPVMWLVFFILATSVVILLGVNKGIENISKVLMPLLVVLSVIIAVFVVTRPGAGAGIVYYLKPDLSKISANAFLLDKGHTDTRNLIRNLFCHGWVCIAHRNLEDSRVGRIIQGNFFLQGTVGLVQSEILNYLLKHGTPLYDNHIIVCQTCTCLYIRKTCNRHAFGQYIKLGC